MGINIGRSAAFDSAAVNEIRRRSDQAIDRRESRLDEAQANRDRAYDASERRATNAAEERQRGLHESKLQRQEGYRQQDKRIMLQHELGQQDAQFRQELAQGNMDYQYSAKNQAEFDRYQVSIDAVEADETFTEAQKEEAISQLRSKQLGIKKTPSLRNQSEFPEGQGIGDSWQQGNAIVTRNSKGEIKETNRKIGNDDFMKAYETAREGSLRNKGLDNESTDWNDFYGTMSAIMAGQAALSGIELDAASMQKAIMAMVPVDDRQTVLAAAEKAEATEQATDRPAKPAGKGWITTMDEEAALEEASTTPYEQARGMDLIDGEAPPAEADAIPEALAEYAPEDQKTLMAYAETRNIPLETVIARYAAQQ